MHIAYPYCDELVALAKHYHNVYPDLCWAWSIDPYSAADFVRRYLHAAPANKLFAFGGDTTWPRARRRTPSRRVAGSIERCRVRSQTGLMTEAEAMAVATKLMQGNQLACFDLVGTRAACAT